ncbi:hypothetical protein DEU56DRAFT_810814 [Suillus clintonianus]|uniref:uncharacterized protein n=1 Tax=Suillus clintonianus TaxID=1904413 RepID=UPI001B8735EC|nr:uncharacterized protein DEU56DRAFT_810814 [Suillus clintonianus]KAG2133294.1 hypothetical protein DEU56DRAFT_810814 [Suillus clintonianus]
MGLRWPPLIFLVRQASSIINTEDVKNKMRKDTPIARPTTCDRQGLDKHGGTRKVTPKQISRSQHEHLESINQLIPGEMIYFGQITVTS